MKKAPDLTGQRFGRLVVLERNFTYKKAAYWICQCDCGTKKTIQSSHLRSGATKSCGCLHDESARKTKVKTHGESNTRLYAEWISMKARCYNPRSERYDRYGGRGIMVCEEWKNSFQAFRDWALANGYREDLTIDRIDVNGNYEPSNCRWITNQEQQNNRSNNLFITFNGKTQTVTQWAKETGISEWTIRARIKKLGWNAERTLTEPVQIQEKKPNRTCLLEGRSD